MTKPLYRRRHSTTGLLLFLGAVGTGQLGGQTVAGTRHDLSAASGNQIRATSSTEPCAFCHTPHGSRTDAPLWNRNHSSANYTPYTGSSMQGVPGQPDGYSKLCLSCHDGTIAIGGVINVPNSVGGASIATVGTDAQGRMPAGTTNLGTNLTDDHPVSFVFNSTLQTNDGELVNPTTLTGAVRLYPGTTPTANAVQCVSCHDPHDNSRGKFLKQSPRGRTANLCLTCHAKTEWSGSSHEAASQTASIGGITDAVSAHSCLSCHAPHAPSGAERLLRNGAASGQSAIEQTCYQCHGSSGPGQNIQSEFLKTSRHDIANYTSQHRPIFLSQALLPENVQLTPGSPAPLSLYTDQRHVECVDCHNPHRLTKANPLQGIRGISLTGTIVTSPRADSGAAGLSEQYTVCFRCHGDSYATALPPLLGSGLTPRNKKVEFQTTNNSFHPVTRIGRNPSTRLNTQLSGAGVGVNAVIKCTDCHNSDTFTGVGRIVRGTGTRSGPHGSSRSPVLRANYLLNPQSMSNYSSTNFTLCWRCHNEASFINRDNTGTNFFDALNGKDNLHWVHLEDRIDKTGAVCRSCHYNTHANTEASNTEYSIDGVIYQTPPTGSFVTTRMISFHPNVRPRGTNAKPRWIINTSTRTRTCQLVCHSSSGGAGGGADMNLSYRPGATGDVPSTPAP